MGAARCGALATLVAMGTLGAIWVGCEGPIGPHSATLQLEMHFFSACVAPPIFGNEAAKFGNGHGGCKVWSPGHLGKAGITVRMCQNYARIRTITVRKCQNYSRIRVRTKLSEYTQNVLKLGLFALFLLFSNFFLNSNFVRTSESELRQNGRMPALVGGSNLSTMEPGAPLGAQQQRPW